MKHSRIRLIVPAALVLALAMTAFGGGWAVITVQNLPEYLVAGKPTTLTFLIRQHGWSLTDGMNARLSATDSHGLSAKGVVTPSGNPGEYKAVLSVPQAGDWVIRIDPDLGQTALRPIKAIQEGDPAPASPSKVTRGEDLFIAKGCITCHVNKEVTAQTLVSNGPDLTARKFQADFLKKFLADPQGTMGKSGKGQGMPNLNLAPEEIDAIEAFINRSRSGKF